MNLPICINSLKDAEGHDASHYLCDVQNFRAVCVIQGLSEEEALVLVPDENDAFSYRQLLMQLAEMKDQVEADDFVNLLTKIVDVRNGKNLLRITRSPPVTMLTVSRILSAQGSSVSFLPSVLTRCLMMGRRLDGWTDLLLG